MNRQLPGATAKLACMVYCFIECDGVRVLCEYVCMLVCNVHCLLRKVRRGPCIFLVLNSTAPAHSWLYMFPLPCLPMHIHTAGRRADIETHRCIDMRTLDTDIETHKSAIQMLDIYSYRHQPPSHNRHRRTHRHTDIVQRNIQTYRHKAHRCVDIHWTVFLPPPSPLQ